jgi:hypothetical protein
VVWWRTVIWTGAFAADLCLCVCVCIYIYTHIHPWIVCFCTMSFVVHLLVGLCVAFIFGTACVAQWLAGYQGQWTASLQQSVSMAAVCICPLNLTEKLLVAQIVKKFHAFYETRAFITACTTPWLKTVECLLSVMYGTPRLDVQILPSPLGQNSYRKQQRRQLPAVHDYAAEWGYRTLLFVIHVTVHSLG